MASEMTDIAVTLAIYKEVLKAMKKIYPMHDFLVLASFISQKNNVLSVVSKCERVGITYTNQLFEDSIKQICILWHF